MKSWKSQYIDRDIVRGFKRHIDENWRLASLYARFLALVQSSGVGKSKLMDEISKEDYTMPVCLRDPDAPGTQSDILRNSLNIELSLNRLPSERYSTL